MKTGASCAMPSQDSGHLPHLESLSLQLLLLEEEGGSNDFACFDDISEPPKTLKRLKVLYSSSRRHAGAGCASIRPVWVKQFPNLEGSRHEATISSQEDVNVLKEPRGDCHVE